MSGYLIPFVLFVSLVAARSVAAICRLLLGVYAIKKSSSEDRLETTRTVSRWDP